MSVRALCSLTLSALILVGTSLHGQDTSVKQPTPSLPSPPVPSVPVPAPPPATAVAATVNGQAIPEIAVYRAIVRENPKNAATARTEIITFLIDNALVDQYLVFQKINVDAKDVDAKIEEIKVEAKKQGPGLEQVLKSLFLTEDELRREMVCTLRWDKFVEQQATDKTLKDMFDKNPAMFDGTQMQARHILIKTGQATAKDPKVTPEQAAARIQALKRVIEERALQELAKLPAEKQNELERVKILEKVFAETATKESNCPSKENGGNLGWFGRVGTMVEPFARAAFALKPYQMSDVVNTQFGCHLILATDRKAGKDVRFEDVKPLVRAVYSERLHDAVIAAMRPRAQIVIQPAK